MKKSGFLGIFWLGLMGLGTLRAAEVPDFVFSRNGQKWKTLSRSEMQKRVGEVKLKTVEPHNGQTVTYIGFSFPALLEAVYGPQWKQIKKYNFTCLDGYRPQVNTKKFVQYPSYLVYAKEGAADFLLKKDNEGGKVIDMAPYYITWDTIRYPELKGNLYDRPYQLVAVDVAIEEVKK